MVSFVCLFHGSLHSCTTASSCWCSLTTTQRQQCCSFLLLHSQNGTQRKPWCFHSQGTGVASDLSLVSPSSSQSSFFSSSSSSSSVSLSSLASSFLSSAAFASSSSFFLLFSTSLKSFHFFCKSIGFSFVVSDDDIVEDGTTLDLSKIKSNKANVIEFIDRIILLIFWVCDFFSLPKTFVGWVGNPFCCPITFVSRIVFHWSFPLTIFLIIPIIRLLSLTVSNALLLNPIIRFLLCWVINHRLVRPVLGFFVIWI